MHPFMVAMGPDIKPQTGIQKLEQIDIYSFVCGLLRLQMPNKMDGDIRRVTRFMANPPSEDFIKTFMDYARGLIPIYPTTSGAAKLGLGFVYGALLLMFV